MINFKLITQLQTKQDFENLLQGATFLGAGGGGSLAGGRQIIKQLLNRGNPIPVIQPEDLKQSMPQKLGGVVAGIGAPSKIKPIDFTAPERALNTIEKYVKEDFHFVVPIEIGAANTFLPMTISASRENFPVLDGDGAGRAVPQIDNTVFALKNIPVSPMTLSNNPYPNDYPYINTVIDLTENQTDKKENLAKAAENIARNIVSTDEFEAQGAYVTYMMVGGQTPQVCVPHTISLSYAIGQIITDATSKSQSPTDTLLAFLKQEYPYCYQFGPATVTELKEPSPESGFDVGYSVLTDVNGDTLTLHYENENLFSYKNEDKTKIWAMAPDLMCFISDNGAISNAEIKKGMKLTVIGLPVNNLMREPFITDAFMDILATLKIYTGDYIKIESLHSAQ